MKNELLQQIIAMSKYTLIGVFMQCFLTGMLIASSTKAQRIMPVSEVYVNLNISSELLSDIFNEIEKTTDFVFHYYEDVNIYQKVKVNRKKQSVSQLLLRISEVADLSFRQVNNVISVKPIEKGYHQKKVKLEIIIQAKEVSGRVISTDDNEPIPGVNVIEKGSTNGTVTNIEGEYSLSVSEDAILLFSYVGYTPEEVQVANQSTINVSLSPDVQQLQELVVVGYASQKKANLTGAVHSVKAKDIASRPITQTSTVLQGLVPGVVVQQNLGTPGNDDASIRIRGIGSLGQGNQQPLVLIDGMQAGLSDVNPEDIESVSVLKDASSAAIYGSRAANGVILITTKRAEAGTFKVNADFSYGAQSPTMTPEFVDVKTQMMLEDVRRINRGADIEWGRDLIEDHIGFLENNPPNDQYQNNDWYGAMVDDSAPLHREYINFSGGSEKARVAVSLTNMQQDGLIGNSSFNRRSIRSNADISATPWLKLQTDLFIQNSSRKEPAERQQRLWQMVNELEPYRALYVHDSQENRFWGNAWNGNNPVAFTEDGGSRDDENTYTLVNFNAFITPFEGFEVNLGYSRTDDDSKINEFVDHFEYYRPGASIGDDPFLVGKNPTNNSLSMSSIQRTRNYYKAIASYTKQFSNHYGKILVGFDATDNHLEGLSASRQVFPLGINYPQLPLGGEENMNNGSNENEWAIASVFGRFNYRLNDRYLFEASVRYDGSSRFAEDQRWGFFPSFSAGWRISDEPFMQGVGFITDLKLRGSWGQLGNQSIGSNYPYQSVVALDQTAVLSESIQQAAAITSGVPTALTWESATMTNIGLDYGFFDNKLTGSVEYYVKNTNDILWRLSGSETYGLSFPFQNAASMQNKGVELFLSWQETRGDFSYFVNLQFDDNINEVTDLAGTGEQVSNNRIIAEGLPFQALYGWEAIGFLSASDLEDPNVAKQNSTNLAEGSLKFKDQDGNGVIDPEDRVVIGNEFPRLNYSSTIGFNYKGFDFSMLLQGVGKRDGYVRRTGQSFGDNLYTWESDFYIPDDHPIFTDHQYDQLGLQPNTNAAYPASETDNGDLSSHWIQSRSYLRIKNLTLGYNLPNSIIEKAMLKNVRFYISADNLMTWTGFIDGFDPELTSGRGFWEYPNITKYLAGINLTF